MPGPDTGWDWLDAPERASGAGGDAAADRAGTRHDQDLALAFARCFKSRDGQRVWRHLRGLTVDRVLGPDVSDAALRYLEGQRQLIHHIARLVDRGAGRPVDGVRATRPGGFLEQEDDEDNAG